MGEEQGLSAENWATLERVFGTDWTALAIDWRFLNRLLDAARAEGLHPPVGVEDEVFSSLGASRAPSCASAGVAETPCSECIELQRKLKRTEHARDLSRRYWAEAAAKALRALPGAANSMHPAYDLWLRVEMNGLPPESLVLSDDGSPTDCQTSGGGE